MNLTDGLDGLAIMPAVMVAAALGVFAYVTGNFKFATYLQIPYIPGVGEALIFSATLVGAGLGFLWFNSYPAQVFMGDVGAWRSAPRSARGRKHHLCRNLPLAMENHQRRQRLVSYSKGHDR